MLKQLAAPSGFTSRFKAVKKKKHVEQISKISKLSFESNTFPQKSVQLLFL